MITIKNAQLQTTRYGNYKPKYFYKVDNGYFRSDEYKSNLTGDSTDEGVMVTGADDLSHVVTDTYNGENCHCCFAGYAHSKNQCDSHTQKI